MKFLLRNTTLHLILALLAGLGLGLAYSWLISPVTYVDASPALLQADFKDQYRIVIAASYISTHNLDRARARLALLNDTDSVGELSAQAQRMLAAGESFEGVQSLAQLATDLQQGRVNISSITETPTPESGVNIQEASATPTEFTAKTFIAPTARSTSTPVPAPSGPFALISQDTVCDLKLPAGLLQIILMNSRRQQVPGIEITVTWAEGEDHFFSGFKSELGDGYADFIMQADTAYNIRADQGGAFIPNIFAPTCTDPNGINYTGSLLLTFQQP